MVHPHSLFRNGQERAFHFMFGWSTAYITLNQSSRDDFEASVVVPRFCPFFVELQRCVVKWLLLVEIKKTFFFYFLMIG